MAKKRKKKPSGATRRKPSRKNKRKKARKKARKKTSKKTRKTSKKKRPKKKKSGKKTRKKTPKKKTTKKKAKRKTQGRKRASQPSQASWPHHRDHPRLPIRLLVDYFKDSGVFLYDYSRNLGRGGIFIETENPFPSGTPIKLNFTLPNQTQPVEVSGKVVWMHQKRPGKPFKGVPGMGIQFYNPEGPNKESLDRFFREIDFDNLSF